MRHYICVVIAPLKRSNLKFTLVIPGLVLWGLIVFAFLIGFVFTVLLLDGAVHP